ncbi:MAG: TonB-dependent receptor [Myxococcales bacterium]|nr:TonB-dependent receptor [Myxococcales bacterium]
MPISSSRWAALLLAAVSLWLVGCSSLGVRGRARHPHTGSVEWTGQATPGRIYAYTSPGRLPELRDAKGHPLPLRHTGVRAELRGHIAAVKVRQRFHNPSDHPIEVVYTFPLPENSAVFDMRMTVGSRVIEAEIMRREQARQTFEEARDDGHTASLLEQERPNVFTQSVTNIAPGEDVDVEIRYLQTLTYDAGEYEFVFPMVVGPRFDPGDGSVPDAARISPPVVGHGVRTGHDIDIEVHAQPGPPVVSWTAPTHQIEAQAEDGALTVSLARRDELPNRDFVLRYRVAGPEARGTVLLGKPDEHGRGHYLMVVHPPVTDVDAAVGRREVIFVVDRSGSMGGSPLALAKQTVRELLARLRPVDTFDVVGFASGTERLFGQPRPANAENLTLALRFVDQMYGGGGTMMRDAVEASLSDAVAPGFNRYVLFLTDGYVGNEHQIFQGARRLVERTAKRGNVARVFGIGIGSSPNRHLIEGLSRAGDGVPRNIASREEPARVVNALMHDIDHAVLTELRLPRLSPLRIDPSPAELPDLFVSQPVVVLGRYHSPVGDSVVLEAKQGQTSTTLALDVQRVEGAETLLPTLWARAKVDELEMQQWHGDRPDLAEQITALGLQYHLVTAYTSLVAVDRSRVVGDGNPERVEQPVAAPEGVDPEAAGARPYDGDPTYAETLAADQAAMAALPAVPPSAGDGSASTSASASPSASPSTSTVATTSAPAPSAPLQPDGNGNYARMIRVAAVPVSSHTAVGRTVSMEEIRAIPVGSSTSRDFTQVVESSATASYDSAGISLAGATGAESKYTVEGANLGNPAFGTVGASIVQEFVEKVEVLEAGYDAEYGGASGGQVVARRASGTNILRGVARFTVTPRLAAPRFIHGTDNAVRTTEIPDFAMQGVISASGPVIRDRLFWSAGIALSGSRSSLVQTFHRRVDADGSGDLQGCPLENGAFDCEPGKGHITTEEFAEQRFRTRTAEGGYQLGLDWAINPYHRLEATVGGSPRFVRRSYRHAASSPFDPQLMVDPRGGSTLVANGLVGDHLGWDRSDALYSSLHYQGRVADDRVELEATLAYSRFSSQTAWRLDDPGLRDRPATQTTDAQGADLFALLDQDGRLDQVPGVTQACNGADLPGSTCPVRLWLSGGLGQYGEDHDQRAEGSLAATHFFNAAGAHQLKYGVAYEHLRRHTVSRYSGSNAADFYGGCAAEGLTGPGGEWCLDEASRRYVISNAERVDNHRYVAVDLDAPDQRTTFGYGRVAKELGQLRAIATPQGAGVRAPAYDERLSANDYGLFLQDKWAILSNLFLSAGVRWELQDMRDVLGRRALFIRDNVGPRVGVVYDWTDEGRSRLFASYGWFYQPLPLQLTSRVFGGLVDVRRTYRNAQCQGQQVTIDGQTFAREQDGQPTEHCPDFAASTSQLVEGAVVPRLRGQYSQQLQLGYEHEVVEDLVLGLRWLHTGLGRAVEDVSTNGGQDYVIANPGEPVAREDIARQRAQCTALEARLQALAVDDPSRAPLSRELQRCLVLVDAFEDVDRLFDEPRRSFDALTLEARKRLSRYWTVVASYTYSRLWGNYDGFVDPVTGAINLGASTQYDTPELVRNSYGPLSFDTPHRFKLDGFYALDLREAGRLTLGTSLRVSSGFPISMRAGHERTAGAPVYVLPRGSGGRIQPNARWNLSVSYAYPLPGNLEFEASIRLINVTNARAVLRVDEIYSFQNTRAVAGGTLEDLKHTKIQSVSDPNAYFQRTIVARQGNYGVETSFQTPLAASFDLQLRF